MGGYTKLMDVRIDYLHIVFDRIQYGEKRRNSYD